MISLLEIVFPVLIVVIGVIVYLLFPRVRGIHLTSRLICPECGKQFDYPWIPGGSFSAVRLGTKRYMQCPYCHKWSIFEIWSTRIKKREH